MNKFDYERRKKAFSKIPDPEKRAAMLLELEKTWNITLEAQIIPDGQEPEARQIITPDICENPSVNLKIMKAKKSGEDGDNCVYFARSIVPSLPLGLTYKMAKKAIINKLSPTPGSVAVINMGDHNPIWHLAIVQSVSETGNVKIVEANWNVGEIGEREGQESDLKIVGYFDPTAPPGVVLA